MYTYIYIYIYTHVHIIVFLILYPRGMEHPRRLKRTRQLARATTPYASEISTFPPLGDRIRYPRRFRQENTTDLSGTSLCDTQGGPQ